VFCVHFHNDVFQKALVPFVVICFEYENNPDDDSHFHARWEATELKPISRRTPRYESEYLARRGMCTADLFVSGAPFSTIALCIVAFISILKCTLIISSLCHGTPHANLLGVLEGFFSARISPSSPFQSRVSARDVNFPLCAFLRESQSRLKQKASIRSAGKFATIILQRDLIFLATTF
jgi:hypothetical protein